VRDEYKLLIRQRKAGRLPPPDFLGLAAAEQVRRFHESFPQYQMTPLAVLDNLAKELGVAKIYVKDESYRFRLNAFKVLGGSYAVGRIIAQRLGLPAHQLTYQTLTARETRDKLGNLTFVTATDGNHGRGIAWTAAVLGQKAVVYMPQGAKPERVHSIRATGAEVVETCLSYDDAVRHAAQMAEQHGWLLVQDTAWAGYEEIPVWIMQGYLTMAYEAYQQLRQNGEERPTHIILQAGVGSMAGAVLGFFVNMDGEDWPVTVIVEPDQADCLFRTAQAGDRTLRRVTGRMDTIMAGLACGEPNPVGWKVLDAYADAFVSCPDPVAAQGMRILGNPAGADPRVISGESGAVGIGLAAELLTRPEFSVYKERLQLDQNARILFFSTEGDTDRAGYRSVVWNGAFPLL